MPAAAEDGEAALNRLAEEQRRQTGAAWGTDANLHVSLEHLQAAPPVQPVQEPCEEPAEEPWEDTEDEPFVTSVHKKSNVPSWAKETVSAPVTEEPAAPAEEIVAPAQEPVAPVEKPAVQQEEPAAPVQEPAALPAEEPEEEPAPQQARPRLGDPDHTTTMEDVDELLRQLLNG